MMRCDMKKLLLTLAAIFLSSSAYGQTTLYSNSATGNVGIGTATPNQLLQIYTPNGSGGELQITNSATGAGSSNGLLVGYNASNDVVFNNQASSQEKFYTNNTFAMAITSGQQVGIQTNTPGYTLQVNGSVAGTSAYVNTSDVRHKKNIKPLDVGLREVVQLQPVIFEWKDHVKDNAMKGQQIGFIAQDVEKILPSVVVTEDNPEKTKGMKYAEIIPVLTKAIQELKASNDGLKSSGDKLQAQLTKDEAILAAMKAKLGM
jgi:hypothetical protein